MPAFYRHVEVFQNAHFAGRAHLSAVTGNRYELNRQRNIRRPHQVAQEGASTFEHADQEGVAASVVAGNLRAQFPDAVLDRLEGDEWFKIRIAELRHDSRR